MSGVDKTGTHRLFQGCSTSRACLVAACVLMLIVAHAMPTKRELAEAQKPVSAQMAQELRAFVAGEKTAAETFVALRNRAAEAEKESERYLLL